MLFIEQGYAGGAGRGYGAGPAGQLGALTLIDPGSVRRAAWANTLTEEMVKWKYADDDDRPWSNAKRVARPRASIGIVGGLFFQPRGIWLIPAGDGVCSFSGRRGPLVRRSPFLPKSALTKKAKGVEDLWQHPCAPLALNSQGIGAVRLNAERPAWAGLAQLLNPLSKKQGRVDHPSAGPAPVLQQWKALGSKTKRPRLLVLDFDRDKANVKRRFFEVFPLTDQLIGKGEAVERLRVVVDDAQHVRLFLVQALTRAHDDHKHGGLALADAETSFWTASEPSFVDWLTTITAVDTWTDEAAARVDAARETMHLAVRTAAQAIFDAHISLSEFDPRKQARVAMARRCLVRDLYPTTTASPAPAFRGRGDDMTDTRSGSSTRGDALRNAIRDVRRRYDQLDRGQTAPIRRCRTADEVALEGAYWRIGEAVTHEQWHLPHVVLLFPLAPHTVNDRFSFGCYLRKQCGNSDTASLRFRRLLDSRDRNELDHRLRGLLRACCRRQEPRRLGYSWPGHFVVLCRARLCSSALGAGLLRADL